MACRHLYFFVLLLSSTTMCCYCCGEDPMVSPTYMVRQLGKSDAVTQLPSLGAPANASGLLRDPGPPCPSASSSLLLCDCAADTVPSSDKFRFCPNLTACASPREVPRTSIATVKFSQLRAFKFFGPSRLLQSSCSTSGIPGFYLEQPAPATAA